MKATKTADIRKMQDAEIAKTITDKRTEIRTQRFGATGGRAKDVKAVRAMRKDVARMLTELQARKK